MTGVAPLRGEGFGRTGALQVVVHIGFPKTGTTALQRGVFPHLPGVRLVVPFQGPRNPGTPGYGAVVDKLNNAADAAYAPQEIRAFIGSQVEASDATLVISDEGLSGTLYHGRGERDRTAARLHALLPASRVLMVVREQSTMIRSFYSQYVHKGGYGSFRTYIENRAPGVTFDLDYFKFDEVVSTYEGLFGAGQVKVLAYEQLQTDPSAFLAQVTDFVGGASGTQYRTEAVPVVNRSLSPPSRWLLRRSNRLLRHSQFNRDPRLRSDGIEPYVRRGVQLADRLAGRYVPSRMALGRKDRELLDRLLPAFRESNDRLTGLTGLPLRALGYVTSRPAPSGKED